MIRLALSCAAAALLALPVMSQPASAAKARKPAVHHTTRHATPAAARRGNDPQGNAAVDALNAQSLDTARGGVAR